MVRHRLPRIITVVMNNGCWGCPEHGQDALYGEGTAVAVKLPDTRYDLIAKAFGCHGDHVTTVDDIARRRERVPTADCPRVSTSASAPTRSIR